MSTTATAVDPTTVAAADEMRELRDRVGHLERQVAELREAKLAQAVVPGGSARLQTSDKAVIRAVMSQVLAELGIPEDMEPDITPGEVQRRMLEDGLDPNERVASRAIIAMRERRP